ncbi:PLC-like phosphodiesterase [Flagelloscypha sp. PMI_526]|nr:PLC-like phosphodiesterase [Flagelloscypha sp. PMI_526]
MLQAQAHKDLLGKLHFCHTSCFLFDGGRVSDYLKEVKSWLDTNPNEVLTLLFTNPEAVPVENEWKAAFDESGVTPLAFVPKSLPVKKSDWPTLGEMIDSGKRVVVFMDSNADPSKVDFILPQFDMVWEPPFSQTDASFPCKVDRITGSLSTADHMYMLNHNLNTEVIDIGDGILVPDFLDIDKTNSLDSILGRCQRNSKPNFVMLDFVNKGDGVKVVDQLNGF